MKQLLLGLVLLIVTLGNASAKDPHGIADACINPAECHHWFENVMQPDNPQVSCCGYGDAFEADDFTQDPMTGQYIAIITDGKGYVPNGTKVLVPNNKIKWNDPNPTGHGIIFMSSDMVVYCYCPPVGL